MHKTKDNDKKRYAFKIKLMREIVRSKRYSREAVQAMFHFIDYLLRLPKELSKELAESIRPILREEESYMLQANRENPSPTLKEIFELEREEGELKGRVEGRKEGEMKGRKEGRQEEKIQIAKKMLQSNMEIEQIMSFTGLSKEELKRINEKNIIEFIGW